MNMRHTAELSLICAIVLVSPVVSSCRKDKNAGRSEEVRFYLPDNPQTSINYLQIPLEGVSDGVIYIESNTPVNVETQLPAEDVLSSDPWIDVNVTQESDRHYVIRYSASALKGDLKERTASVNATSIQMYLGAYLKICQGYELFWTNVFTGMDHLVLDESRTNWQSSFIPGIASTSYDYVSFNAYAVNPGAVSTKELYPLELSIPEGTYFDSNGRNTFVVDVSIGEEFNDDNLIYLPFRSTAEGFSSETAFTFRSLSTGENIPALHIGNIKVYKVSDQLRQILEGGDFDEGGYDDFE